MDASHRASEHCHKCNGLGFEMRLSGISKEEPFEPYYLSVICAECRGTGRNHSEGIDTPKERC